MSRGTRWRRLAVAAILVAISAASVAPTTGSGSVARSFGGAQNRAVRLKVDAVAYHLKGRTASGLPCGPGVAAVDPKLIPLGSRMRVPGYGPAVAADVGTAIKGHVIDLWMPTTAAARRWGRHTVVITVYR